MLDLPKFCWGMKSLGHADTPSYDKASLWTGILFLRTLLRRLNCVCALANSLGTLFPVSLPALLTRNRKSDALLSCLYFFWLCARLQFKIHLYRFNSVRLKFLWCIDLVVGLYSSLGSFQTYRSLFCGRTSRLLRSYQGRGEWSRTALSLNLSRKVAKLGVLKMN
jgi:hypothetical protein